MFFKKYRSEKKSVVKYMSSVSLAYKGFVVLPSSFLYSKISAGWQSKALQIDSKVLNLIAFAFPVFKMERFDKVKSTLSESSLREILRLAIITSKFTMIGMA